MKNWITVSLAAGMLAASPSAVLAQDSTNTAPNAAQGAVQTPSAAERKAELHDVLAILGITRKDLKPLTREERREKINAAAKNMITALDQKLAAGTLTPKEQSDLSVLKRFMHHHKANATPGS